MKNVINPLPDDKILDWSKWKQIAEKCYSAFKIENKYHKGWTTLWEEDKLLVTSNFSFSYNVFHSYIYLLCQNAVLCVNRLSEPLASLITFFRTTLIKFYYNNQWMSESFHYITESSKLNWKIRGKNILIWPCKSAMF